MAALWQVSKSHLCSNESNGSSELLQALYTLQVWSIACKRQRKLMNGLFITI
jgi:hypothetical protein